MNNNYEKYNCSMDNRDNNSNNDLTLNQLIENYQINRNKDVYLKNDVNPILLDDRTMFNKFSNSNDTEIDFNVNNEKFNFRSVHIYNNKKNLINNPYIVKNNDGNNGGTIKAGNDDNGYQGYQEVSADFGSGSFDRAYHSEFNNSNNTTKGMVISNNIITDFINLTSTNTAPDSNINMQQLTISPYLLSYLIYSIILLSKNPSTDALLEIYKFKSKDIAINEMKEISENICKYGNVSYVIPENGNNNTTFINKIKDIFNINISHYKPNEEQECIIYANFDFKLGIPMYYNPEVINYKNRKFIKMSNVILSYQYMPQENIGCIEILLHTYKLGFIFNKGGLGGLEGPASLKVMMQNKEHSIVSKIMLIPNISRTIKDCYYNVNKLPIVHLGELINGVMLKSNIFLNTSIEMDIIPVGNGNNKVNKVVNKTVINFKQYYYYIKDDKNNVIYCSFHKEI